MKSIYFLFSTILLSVFLNAQVGINTANPHPSAILDISANDKGVGMPHVNLTGKFDTTSINQPQKSLIVFNSNNALVGGLGYYFWTGFGWDFLFSDLNGYLLQNLTKNYSKSNSATNLRYNYVNSGSTTDDFYNTKSSIGDSFSGGEWRAFTDLDTSIEIDRPDNDLLFTLTGMMQTNNNSGNGNILNAVFGIFIKKDGEDESLYKLVDVASISHEYKTQCAYRAFTVYGLTKNLDAGKYDVRFAVKNMSSGSNNIFVTYGAKDSGCSSNHLTNDEAQMSANILINQPFNF